MLRRLIGGRAGLAMMLSLLAWVAVGPWSLAEDATKNSADREAIATAIKGYIAAFEKGDMDAVVSRWAPDAEYIDESGKITQGRSAIAALLRKNFKNVKGYKLELRSTAFRFITPDVALSDGKATWAAPDGAEDQSPYSAVWVKRDGNWMLRSLRDLPDESGGHASVPADRLKPLTWLLGDWVSTQRTPEINLTCRWAPGKSFLLLEYHMKAADRAEVTTQLLGWDQGNERFRSWSFDSAGGFGEGVWQQADDHWSGNMTDMLPDGRLGEAKHIVHPVDHNSWTWQARDRMVDGRPLADMEVRFVRKSARE
jgi:uncharacterized protein (TIGR02246 family)